MSSPNERQPVPHEMAPSAKPRQPNVQGSSRETDPPRYSPVCPPPIMCGIMEKRAGRDYGKHQSWTKKYVEVSDGALRFYNSKEEASSSNGVTVSLSECSISIQDKRNICLENKSVVRVFRASCALRAQQWAYVISRYCFVPPTAEGFCKKLSARADIRQERYLRLTGDGILSWYKTDKEDDECRGSIQIRGEKVIQDIDDKNILHIHTQDRDYLLEFLDDYDANQWFIIANWHSQLEPILKPPVKIRNSLKNLK